MTVAMKSAVFWNVALCRCYENHCFGGKCRLHVQDRNNRRVRSIIAVGSQNEPVDENIPSEYLSYIPVIFKVTASLRNFL
jgi:hypothetical protein